MSPFPHLAHAHEALETVREAIQVMPYEDLFDVAAQLEGLKARVTARLSAPSISDMKDRLLTADEVAERLNVGRTTVYRNAAHYPFAIRVTEGGALRFSERLLTEYMQGRAQKRGR